MKKQMILLLLLVTSCGFLNVYAQGLPFAYDVENTGADCPDPPLASFSELPTTESF